MKFFWKIFFAFTALVTLVFSVFGIWMITQTFHNSLEKEIEEGNRENRMFQLAFETNMNSLSEHYKTEKVIKDLAESIITNLDDQEYSYRLYKGAQGLIYENTENRLEHQLMEELAENDCVYQVLEAGDRRYLIFVCKSVMSGRVYYLESAKDITELYEERDRFYDQYRVIMLALIGISSLVIFVLSHLLTRSVVELSDTTRRFAEGDYGARADIYGEDEIGTLARDFNQMADNLNQKMEELTDAARQQEDFTASFAHELKTPLTSIIGYADMLRTMEMTDEETVEASNYIYSQGKRLESLSLKLLELIVTKYQDYQFKQISITALLQEVRELTAKSLEKKNITCSLQVEESSIYGEKDLLISLFTNLVDNARKALLEGGSIWINGQKTEKGYEVAVRDNGCGMPREEIDKITEAFYMVDKSRSRREGGAGLGMTLCSRIIEVHGAEWSISSSEGQGTEICVCFPGRETPYGN
ncbi:MAG: HAMP domain-containing histidine kinase [Lachnospiraceae bacterium]|nr:HAMP domain-containing histidine kinase [Lachnospiraceae bacterium]